MTRPPMRGTPQAVLLLFVGLSLSGCLGGSDSKKATTDEGTPPGWDEDAPAESRLADGPFYTLDSSASFILKGHSYGRYIVRVPEAVEDAHVFFSTGNLYTQARGPSIDDPDNYHFEFMQIRPLGLQVKTADVDAVAQFRHAQTPGVFTLTYLYGKDANHQFLAPYEGRPDHWRFEPGFYEFVIATDEQLTVGINVHLGGSYWSTYYHPQELGSARGEALDFRFDFFETAGGRLPDVDDELHAIVKAGPGEFANYFTFSDLWYETKLLAVGATATATVTVDDQSVPHKLDVTTPGPAQDEAYAFAMNFNQPGPVETHLKPRAVFHEEASAQSALLELLFVFGVVLSPDQAVTGLPAGQEL